MNEAFLEAFHYSGARGNSRTFSLFRCCILHNEQQEALVIMISWSLGFEAVGVRCYWHSGWVSAQRDSGAQGQEGIYQS